MISSCPSAQKQFPSTWQEGVGGVANTWSHEEHNSPLWWEVRSSKAGIVCPLLLQRPSHISSSRILQLKHKWFPYAAIPDTFPVSHALVLDDSKEEVGTNKICMIWNACLTIVEVLPSAFPHLLSLFIAIPYCVMCNLDCMLLEVRICQILFVCTMLYTPMAL